MIRRLQSYKRLFVGVAIGTSAALRQRVVTPNIDLSLNIDLI